jgi:hypothetical protein
MENLLQSISLATDSRKDAMPRVSDAYISKDVAHNVSPYIDARHCVSTANIKSVKNPKLNNI